MRLRPLHRRILALLILFLLLAVALDARAEPNCRMSLVTAYAAESFPGLTYDETPTWPNVGAIVAAGRGYELGQAIWIEDVGARRVADRGRLSAYQIDLLVATHAEAINWGRQYLIVCG